MSKNKTKGKDKKAQNYEQLQKEFEAQKRELIDTTFTLKKVQERLNFLTQENHRLEAERQDQYYNLNDKIEELTIKNDTNEKRLISMRNDLTNSQVQNKKLINNLSLLEKNMSDERADRTKELQEMRKNYNFQITKYENMLTDYKLYMSERDARQKEINELFEAKQIQIANRIRDVADKEREKVQATDKIRDEMGNKIRDMRQNLLSLKKEELETTTRLTMLQNHQLTSQLEYQSKQTQRIVFKNQQLEGTISKLKQDLDIHKQIEDQLAKRAHFSKGIIKKLHAKVEQLEEKLEKVKGGRPTVNCNLFDSSQSVVEIQKGVKQQKMMVQAIDKELEKAQKKYADLQTRYQSLLKQKDQLSLRWQTSQRSKNELYNTLLKKYTQLQYNEAKESESKENEDIVVDLNGIKQKNPKEWSSEELTAVLQILLLTCQSYITTSNLNIPSLKRIVVLSNDKDKELKPFLPKLSTDRDKRLVMTASQKKLDLDEDICLLAKNELCKEKYSMTIGSRMVTSKLREWGRQVPCKNKQTLSKKYQLSCSYRT